MQKSSRRPVSATACRKGGIDRGQGADAVPGPGVRLDREVDPLHDVRERDHPLGRHRPPRKAARREGRERLREAARGQLRGVAEVVRLHHPCEAAANGLGHVEVHVRHPGGQHVGRVAGPLDAAASAERLQGGRVEVGRLAQSRAPRAPDPAAGRDGRGGVRPQRRRRRGSRGSDTIAPSPAGLGRTTAHGTARCGRHCSRRGQRGALRGPRRPRAGGAGHRARAGAGGGSRRQQPLHGGGGAVRLRRGGRPRGAHAGPHRGRAPQRRLRRLHARAVLRRPRPPHPVALRPGPRRDPHRRQLRRPSLDARLPGAFQPVVRAPGVQGGRALQVLGRARGRGVGRGAGARPGAHRVHPRPRHPHPLRDPGDGPRRGRSGGCAG